MKTRKITPGQRLHKYNVGDDGNWERLSPGERADYEADAKSLGIPPLTEEVPPPTDVELWKKAYGMAFTLEERIPVFLRLARERDGEPLPVTGEQVCQWWHKRCVNADDSWEELAGIINAHHGVRPEMPKVTAAMFDGAYDAYHKAGRGPIGYIAAADYLNAELAKAARKDGAA